MNALYAKSLSEPVRTLTTLEIVPASSLRSFSRASALPSAVITSTRKFITTVSISILPCVSEYFILNAALPFEDLKYSMLPMRKLSILFALTVSVILRPVAASITLTTARRSRSLISTVALILFFARRSLISALTSIFLSPRIGLTVSRSPNTAPRRF